MGELSANTRMPPEEAEPSAWSELLDQLSRELPDLASQYVTHVSAVTGYQPGALVSRDDLSATALDSLRLLIESMRAGRPSERLVESCEELGRRRARQQVPADSLAAALRSDFSVIWARLIELTSGSDADLTLARQVEPIWHIVETFSNTTMRYYREEEAQIAQDRINHRQVAIGRLLSFKNVTESLVAWVAAELGCDPDADFTVVVADQEESRNALFELAGTLRHSPFYFHRSSGIGVAFWPVDQTPDSARPVLAAIRSARSDVVPGLARLPRAVVALTTLLDAMDPKLQRPVGLDEGTALLAREALTAQGIDVAGRLDAALADCPESEKARLRETVVAYLRTGNVQQTAAELFYHRNTVLKRLKRFEALTGIDVTVPTEAATVVIAWSTLNA